MRRSSGLFAFAALAALYACGSDSTATPGADGDDGGGSDGGSTALDAGPSDGAPGPDGATPTDSGVDAGKPELGPITCDGPFRVDTAGGAATGVAAVASGDHLLAAWETTAGHSLARAVDGATLGTIVDLGNDMNRGPLLVADDSGHAYAQPLTSVAAGTRSVYTFATGMFGAATSFTTSSGGDTYDALVGSKSGALSVRVQAVGVGGDQSTGGAWAQAGIGSTSGTVYGLRLASTPGTDRRAIIYYSYDMGFVTLRVLTFDGTTWAAEVKRGYSNMPPMFYEANFELATFSNGDPFVLWDDGQNHLMGARYRVGTMSWDADQTIDTYDNATATPIRGVSHVIIDSEDHAAVAWTYTNDGITYHSFYRRDVGAGLGVRKTISSSPTTWLALDRASTVYLVTSESLDAGMPHVIVRRAGLGEPTFAEPGDTGIVAVTTPSVAPRPSVVTFDGSNRPIVVGLDANLSFIPANGVSAARCH